MDIVGRMLVPLARLDRTHHLRRNRRCRNDFPHARVIPLPPSRAINNPRTSKIRFFRYALGIAARAGGRGEAVEYVWRGTWRVDG